MSRLLIDVGNSRLKWTLTSDAGRVLTRQPQQLTLAQAIPHHGDPAAAAALIPEAEVSQIRIANVTGPDHAASLARVLGARFGRQPEFAMPIDGHLGLRIAYADPARLGVDRWLALLAAWSRTGGAACVVSAGTALTFDAVDSNGQHLGGIIAPGLKTAELAVLGATRFKVSGADVVYSEGLGRDTDACVRQGALHACLGLIERLASRHEGTRYLTGGDAPSLRPWLDGEWSLAPDLVLEGLALSGT